MQHAHISTPFSSPQDLSAPSPDPITPPARHQHAADDIDDPHQQAQPALALFAHRKQDGLDVEFEEDARDGALGDGGRVRRGGVLVGDEGIGGRAAAGRTRGGKEIGEREIGEGV